MPTSADLLLDTSAAVALLTMDHPNRSAVRSAQAGKVLGLAGHALPETYSVLTRFAGDRRLSAAAARSAIARAFPASVALSPADSLNSVETLAAAGIAGGAVYDGLVALAAASAGLPLLSCDRRALATYAALGVTVELIGG